MVFWWKAAREARQQNVDTIHLISDVSPIVGLKCFIIRTLSGVPLLLHVPGRGDLVFGYRFLLRADQIITGGSYLREFFPESLDFPPLSPHMNSISDEKDAEHNQIRDSHSPKGSVLYLGAMEPARGVHTLVDAVALLKTRIEPGDLIVTLAWNGYGETGYSEQIRERIKKHNLVDWFRWERSVDDPGILYREHDLVVIPRAFPTRMGFPLRLIEAMSYGKPVIVSDMGEMPVIAKGCGIVFQHEDSSSLADALYLLITNSECYKKYAKNAYRKALEYNPSQTVLSLVELYKELARHG